MSRLSEQQQKDLLAIANQRDQDIDLSDIPEVREIPPDHVIGKFYRPKKTSLTIRLDADVVAWLKASGEAGTHATRARELGIQDTCSAQMYRVELVPEVGLEPTQGSTLADFESAASAIPPLRHTG